MIVFGTKAKHVATFKIETKCRQCESKDTIYMNIFQKYAHVFWIPMFPTSRVPETECSHCKKTTGKEKFSNNMYHVFLKLKKRVKTPVWMYSGLTMLLVVMSVGLANNFIKSKKSVEFVLAPKAGDIYQMKMDANGYSVAKVHHVNGDTTYLLFHQYNTDKVTGLETLKSQGDAAYHKETRPVMTKQLVVMLEEGTIMDVERK